MVTTKEINKLKYFILKKYKRKISDIDDLISYCNLEFYKLNLKFPNKEFSWYLEKMKWKISNYFRDQRKAKIKTIPLIVQKLAYNPIREYIDSALMHKYLKQLSYSDRQLLFLLFYQNYTQKYVAKLYKTTQGVISKNKYNALQRLKKVIENNKDLFSESLINGAECLSTSTKLR